MIKNNYYKVSNINNKKIAVFSDLHYCELFNHNVFVNILKNISSSSPDFICIAGDIVDDSKSLDCKKFQETIAMFLKSLGLIAPTFFIVGNHDQITLENGFYSTYFNEDVFLNLNIDNVYYLSNSNVVIDKINFVGLNPHVDYYVKEPYENEKILSKELNKLESLFSDEYYNILLFHSPINIMNEYIINNCNFFNKINLILSGHMHNGIMPKALDRLRGNIGLISPHKELFPKLARGLKKINDTTLVISGGVIKITPRSSKILHKIKFKQSVHIEYLDI